MQLAVGIILIILGIVVGMFKQTWLLAGFNEKKVPNKDLLATITGYLMLIPIGIFIIIMNFINFENKENIIGIVTIIYIFSFIGYVNTKLVENN